MNRKQGGALLACVLLSCSACNDGGVSAGIQSKNWDCVDLNCDASFVIENSGDSPIELTYQIQLFRSHDEVSLIDAMPAAHYQGEMVMYDRPGHIPGALNIPVFTLLDESGRFRPHDELASMIGGDRNARAITYCGGGISASANAFVMTRLGFTDVAVYTASLQEWAADPANPLEVASSQDRVNR
jgi:3-mercaptopyruvate sulfurtransferase SseA